MRPTRAAITAAAVFSVLAALSTPATAHAAKFGDTVVLSVDEALAALAVRDEDRTGYERTKFRHGTDADHDGCYP